MPASPEIRNSRPWPASVSSRPALSSASSRSRPTNSDGRAVSRLCGDAPTVLANSGVAEWLVQQDPDLLLIVIKRIKRRMGCRPTGPELAGQGAGFWAISGAHVGTGRLPLLETQCGSLWPHALETVVFLRSTLRFFAPEVNMSASSCVV